MIDLFFHEIERHFFREYPKEACGILAVQKGKPQWFPCTNIAEENENFVIDSAEYLKIHRTSDIIGIIHNHPDSDSKASEADIAHCNTLGIPYYIFSYPGMELNTLQPEKNLVDLYGREYSFGVYDCFEASRDYLKSVGIKIKSRVLFEDNWWKKGIDYFCTEMMEEWGFREVNLENIAPNDAITFSVHSDIPNHCGIYLGNDIFYHHAESRLSCRENLFPSWAKYINRVYRYAA
tara:strand:- start:17056 stop:17760 length:705 start_codon:yes stop_codon:yes gene_type:complete